MVKIKVKHFIIGLLLIVGFCVALGLGIGYWIASRPLPSDPTPVNPIVITPITKPKPGVPLFLGIYDLETYANYLSFRIKATGPGEAKVKINKPSAWNVPDEMFSIGLSGGYYCGSWLPGGSFGYYWRVASFRKFNFYIGPELSVAAYNKTHEYEIPVAISISLRINVTYN